MKKAPHRRVTLADIAAQAGVTTATVSLALRNEARISETTARKVQALARTMGYQRDPAIDTLMRRVRQKHVHRHHETIVIISFDNKLHPHPGHARLAEGARERASELGFEVDTIHFKEWGGTPQRLGDILYSRGIRAVLLLPPNAYGFHLDMGWARFAAVTFGHQFAYPTCDRIGPNHQSALSIALEQLTRRGYQKIGFISDPRADVEIASSRMAVYHRFAEGAPRPSRIPALSDSLSAPLSADTFREWYERYKPDAIISRSRPLVLLAEIGLRVPEDIAFVSLSVGRDTANCSGILVANKKLGTAAVDLLSEKLYLNKLGHSDSRRTILIDAEWRDGNTLLPVSEHRQA